MDHTSDHHVGSNKTRVSISTYGVMIVAERAGLDAAGVLGVRSAVHCGVVHHIRTAVPQQARPLEVWTDKQDSEHHTEYMSVM